MWESKRTAISSDGSYTPVSSDVAVYDRATLRKLATFSFPRTGLDATKKTADDEPYKQEVGRGLVDISNTATDKSVVLVVYDSVSSDAAKIIRIDEAASPVSYEVIVTSSDLNLPMPKGRGFLRSLILSFHLQKQASLFSRAWPVRPYCIVPKGHNITLLYFITPFLLEPVIVHPVRRFISLSATLRREGSVPPYCI
ncbi:MAG: hypothetical protein IKQ95_10030 [Synergistaceae bacterium]|nr:hypothetical protein [Synergistaceae bacterium]